MNNLSREAIFADVAHILADFHGHEYLGTIGPETRFFADLGLASIDTVVLGETLQIHYGRTLPFADLMAELGQRPDRDLVIGELLASCTAIWDPLRSGRLGDIMPFARANDLKFHYQQSGAGPDVVLLHGLTGDLSIWLLCQAMQKLSPSFRVTGYDLRGHGYSDVPPAGYTSADQARDLLGLLDVIGAERAHLVGHSFGGVIALHAAVLAPERVASVVLSDPYFPALRHLEDASRWGHWEAFRQEALDAGVVLSDQHWYDLGHFFGQVQHLDGERMLKFRQAVGLPGLNRLKRLSETTCGVDSRVEGGLTVELIDTMARPALALYGEFSPFLTTAYYLEEHLADCRVAIVPGAKHRAPQENGEAFLEPIREFIESIERGEPAATMKRSVSESPSPC